MSLSSLILVLDEIFKYNYYAKFDRLEYENLQNNTKTSYIQFCTNDKCIIAKFSTILFSTQRRECLPKVAVVASDAVTSDHEKPSCRQLTFLRRGSTLVRHDSPKHALPRSFCAHLFRRENCKVRQFPCQNDQFCDLTRQRAVRSDTSVPPL